jgi:membrane-associated protein
MEIVDFILHIDDYLKTIIDAFGPLTYVILFGIIFAETGLVIMPFLPGDSLLFVVGALAGTGLLDFWMVYITLLIAAILGDTVNYWVGSLIGPRVFAKENSRIFKKAYLVKTQEFYEKHGGKTIIIARFVPIVRTFAPFVAGVGKMHYKTFLIYNVSGAFVWVTSLTVAGYFFGSLPWIKNNFELAIFGIIFISLIPMIIEFLRHKKASKSSGKTSYEELKETVKRE